MRKKITIVIVTLLGIALLFAACGTNSGTNTRQMLAMEFDDVFWDYAPDMEESVDIVLFSSMRAGSSYGSAEAWRDAETVATSYNAPGNAEPTDEPILTGRMRIRDVSATIETRQFDRTLAAVQASVLENFGYVQSIDTSDRHTRSASLTLRVPAEHLDDFLASLEEDDSHVANLRDAVRDVTMQHNDLQAEMAALRTEEEALLRLMGTAGDLSDLLAVQTQLSNVRYRINRLEGQVRILQDQVAYSTVSLNIREVERIAPTEQGFWARTFDGFVSSLRDVGNGVLAFVSGVFAALPWLILIVLPLGAVVWLAIRRIRKKIKQKKAAKEF